MKVGSVSHCLLAKLKMKLKTVCTLGSTAVDCWSQAGLELVFEGGLLFLVHLFLHHSFIHSRSQQLFMESSATL